MIDVRAGKRGLLGEGWVLLFGGGLFDWTIGVFVRKRGLVDWERGLFNRTIGLLDRKRESGNRFTRLEKGFIRFTRSAKGFIRSTESIPFPIE